MKRLFTILALAASLALGASANAQDKPAAPAADKPAPAAEAKPAAPAAEKPAAAAAAQAKAEPPKPTVNKGDTTWMLTATALVILMTIPGLALFYGGMVRSKNTLSVLMQVLVTFCMISLLWVIYGYSLAFSAGNAFFGGFDKLFLKGITADSLAATFSKGVAIPEVVFVAFQLTFAAITCALVVGAFAERVKFSAVLMFLALWFTFSYLPIAHMVWYWDGPDAIADDKTLKTVTEGAGWLWAKGALDFAGGTVVHINAGVAGLVGAYLIGKRVGYGRESMAPHNLPLTMIGACMLWVGWFGFNAGSNLEPTGAAGVRVPQYHRRDCGGDLAWLMARVVPGQQAQLGAASGRVAGLVAITPACGFIGVMGGW